jgi:outer membrane protein TolC
MEAVNLLGQKAINAASEARQAYSAYKSTYAIAAKYDNEVLPLREKIASETELQFNAMQVDAFALIQTAKDNRAAKLASIEAHKDFWLASADLSAAILGGRSGVAQDFTAAIPTDQNTEH